MSYKHFINSPTDLVASALRSIPATNPALALDAENKIVYTRAQEPGHVAIVSGGGAGHEPSFVSFVGAGLLRAAVSGTIFASPSVRQIYHAITRRVTPNAGVLLIVMNYTGDVLHFGLASEKAAAAGIAVELVVVADDVGVGRAKNGKVGRRGIAGTVLVHKITGALAADGGSLGEVAALARLVVAGLVSVGSSLGHVHVPGHSEGSGEHEAALKGDEIEVGMGIHNEQGFKRMKIPELGELVRLLLAQLLDKGDKDRGYLEDVEKSEGWVLMVNNLGGVSPLEMGGITAEVVEQLDSSYSINPKRVFSGTFMTSLNGNGFSISLLRLVDTGLGKGKSMLELLDAPHEALGWPAIVKPATWENKTDKIPSDAGVEEEIVPASKLKMDIALFSKILAAGLKKVIDAEQEITKADEIVGDGDCGMALKQGAEAVLRFIADDKVVTDAVVTVVKLAEVVEEHMGGTSGAIYSIFLNSLAKALRETGEETATSSTWATASHAALVSLRKYTPAQPGDRTLVDALQPFIASLVGGKGIAAAAKAARDGAESTRGMKASLGRSVYVGEVGDTLDPGALGIAVLAEGFAEVLKA
ncbi:dihydroxyacetone kinase Dak1 [Maublancomyces gigas]|uniref:Dihydroxyacetone kinase Dak1 n=1 Tax=Discina gigas TaxID=1032678 RepID=A0ABR3GHZ2_9PEZI